MKKSLITQSFETKLKGQFPDVPLSDGIDMDELKKVDPDPLFVTIALSKDNAVARDGLVYTPEFNRELIRQIRNDKSEGNMGHDESLFKDLPESPAIWVGATSDSEGVVWAKAFIWHSDTKQRFKTQKALNKAFETSIVFSADFDQVQINDNDTYQLTSPVDFKLNYLDFTPPNKAMLQFAERDMFLTKQSDDDRGIRFMSMKVDDVPEKIRQQITQGVVQDLTQAHELVIQQHQEEFDKQKDQMAELASKFNEQQVQIKQSALKEIVNEAVKIDDKKADALKELILQSVDVDAEDLEKEVETFMQSSLYTTLNEAVIAQIAGGPQGGQSDDDLKTARQKSIDKALEKAGVKE
jgi:hypothetical protein